jgi:hypothetical protein
MAIVTLGALKRGFSYLELEGINKTSLRKISSDSEDIKVENGELVAGAFKTEAIYSDCNAGHVNAIKSDGVNKRRMNLDLALAL